MKIQTDTTVAPEADFRFFALRQVAASTVVLVSDKHGGEPFAVGWREGQQSRGEFCQRIDLVGIKSCRR